MSTTLVVDAANVVGARADGWWNDRGGAARKLHEELLVADIPFDRIVLVLEGGAKAGVRAGRDVHVQTVHAPRNGDEAIVGQVRSAAQRGDRVTVVTADRMLRARCEGLGATALSPAWLLEHLA